MSEKPVPQKDEAGRFLTGNIGGGRPKGSRNKLGEAFLKALQEDFDAYGAEAITRTRESKPEVYVRVIAGLLPSEHNLTVKSDDLTDDEIRDRIAGLASRLAPFLADRDGSNGEAGGAAKPAKLH
jgi:hypothetical protein